MTLVIEDSGWWRVMTSRMSGEERRETSKEASEGMSDEEE
jgi:hypothetical protein